MGSGEGKRSKGENALWGKKGNSHIFLLFYFPVVMGFVRVVLIDSHMCNYYHCVPLCIFVQLLTIIKYFTCHDGEDA